MITSSNDLKILQNKYKKALGCEYKKVIVCAGTGCISGGSLDIYKRLQHLAAVRGLSYTVELEEEPHEESIGIKKSGCNGFCEMGPLMRIEPYGCLYVKVKLSDCEEIVEKTLIGNEIIERLLYKQGDKLYIRHEEIPFYNQQTRVALENCGYVNSESIKEYIAYGGYQAVQKAIFDMRPSQVIDEIKKSGLRGRGGGGFPTAVKWEQVAAQKDPIRYVVCNGDEGDPGAFMDRSIMEDKPHRMIEGMIIAGYATDSNQGYIYVRAEYPVAVQRLKSAINQACEFGLLGDNIMGSGFSFHIHINQGAGAFVCGEGSALTASIEGNRGMPRVKLYRTVEKGLFGRPTVLNNVETFANVPLIIERGYEWFKSIGSENNSGTKVFALTGNVNCTGLIEVPMGTTLRKIIFDIGGGIKSGKFKAVQIGGPSGGCLTEQHLDYHMDFDSLKKLGAMIGSGGMVVMDDHTCMVEIARFFMNFTQNESCGKCIPCREGTKRMLEILERIVEGEGTLEDLDMLELLGNMISSTSLCGLGKLAAQPVLSTLKYFKDEYIAHVVDKKCPANVCKSLKHIHIKPEVCKGCSKCSTICPAGAITGKLKEPFVINTEKCIKCGACLNSCKFNAIEEV